MRAWVRGMLAVAALVGCKGTEAPAEQGGGPDERPAVAPSRPPLEVDGLRPRDRARAVRDGYGARVEVESAEGVGELELLRPAGEPWPPSVVLRFQELGGLESFTASVPGRGDLVATGRLPHGAESSTTEGPLGLAFARRQGFIEVALPVKLLDPESQAIHVRWVDYLR